MISKAGPPEMEQFVNQNEAKQWLVVKQRRFENDAPLPDEAGGMDRSSPPFYLRQKLASIGGEIRQHGNRNATAGDDRQPRCYIAEKCRPAVTS